jgi:DNA-binding response OmpR family regulator
MHILVIEDNQDLAANLYDFLEGKGYQVDAAADGITGLHLALVHDYDAIVLDLILPGMSGFDLCRKLREEAGKDTPVLMLTARDTLDDKLAGFECGADDYLVKPFSLRELEARLKALARRRHASLAQVLRVADLTLDLGTLQVQRSGQSIELPPIPLKILQLLLRRSPRVVWRREIEQAIWGDSPPDSDALRAHMHVLRNAIDKPFQRPLLHTVRSIGYRLAHPDTPPPTTTPDAFSA